MPSLKQAILRSTCISALTGCMISAAQTPAAPPAPKPPHVTATGINKPGVSRPLSDLHPASVFPVAGSPDWSVVTKDAVWVSSARLNHVVQLLAASNTVGLTADVKRPCSGLADGFGSIWVPSCGDHVLLRIDPATAKPIATIAVVPANSEGGITVG